MASKAVFNKAAISVPIFNLIASQSRHVKKMRTRRPCQQRRSNNTPPNFRDQRKVVGGVSPAAHYNKARVRCKQGPRIVLWPKDRGIMYQNAASGNSIYIHVDLNASSLI